MAVPDIREDAEHPAARNRGICGVIHKSANFEWICVKPVHAKIYVGRKRGKKIYDNNPSADKHFFVNRYPYRKASK